MLRTRKPLAAALLTLAALATSTFAQSASDALDQSFRSPPEAAWPRTWWHWTSGNVTKEGITKDLEWMKRIGIAGMHLADVASGGGQVLPDDQKINFGTPPWYDAVKHAAAEADRLSLEMTLFSSAGWSLTGGPWVKPEQAMKKLVWSELQVEGPRKFEAALPAPPSSVGVFGNLGRGGPAPGAAPRGGATPPTVNPATQPADSAPARGPRGGRAGGPPPPPPTPPFYADSAVIAYRTPADESSMADLKPTVTASGGNLNAQALMDDNLNSATAVAPAEGGGPAWIQYEFPQPITARAVTLVAPGRGVPFGQIQVSDDGKTFRPVASLPGPVQYRAGTVKTYAFPETRTRFVRAFFTAAAATPAEVINQTPTQPTPQYNLAEFIVHTGARIDRWQEKAGFNFFYEYQVAQTPPIPASSTIPQADVINLTSRMNKDGTLSWDVPPGKWTILRMGYSLTGARNRPAPPTGSGLEVDKFSRKHVEAYFHGYVDPLQNALGPLLGKSLRYFMMDSWEAGIQNWTDDMIAEFQKRRGYDPRPWLPVLAGRVVANADLSDRFLWDFRRTIADLVADNHYGTMAELLKQKGIGIYAEAPGVSMEILEDTLLTKSKVDIPMGEFWLGRMHPDLEYYVDVRQAASAAHVYGKKLVATESFTGGGYDAPYTYKRLVDYWFAQGVNRIVFHTSAHQPLDTKPGNTMVGTHINRNITWAEDAKPFMTYLARVSHMLQQGLFVGDIAYLLNEGAPSSQPFWGGGLQPAPPEGYDYDTINADVLLNRLSVAADGRLVLPDGMSYRVLVLPQLDRMRPELLRKIRDLAAGGATIVGPRPVASPSLQGGPNADAEVHALASEIWGDLDGAQRNKHFLGKGLVTWGLPLSQVLSLVNIPKDAEFAGPLDTNISWIHRRIAAGGGGGAGAGGETDIYFVANRTDKAIDLQARFRVEGREAELFHPDTGDSEPASYTIDNKRTTVPLRLAERQSVFVVFRKPASVPARNVPAPAPTTLATLTGPWDVTFAPNLGAPEKITLNDLQSWSAHPEEGVKYFSGSALYTRKIQVPSDWLANNAQLSVDLGNVRDLVEVIVNGKSIDTLWKPPYSLNITSALKTGDNELVFRVVNQWSNRIAGDARGPAERRVLSTPAGRGGGSPFGRGPAAPAESGLLGPVKIVSQRAAAGG